MIKRSERRSERSDGMKKWWNNMKDWWTDYSFINGDVCCIGIFAFVAGFFICTLF